MNTPTIHRRPLYQDGCNPILLRNLSAVLAFSTVFFSRQDWLPVQDALCKSDSESESEQSTTQQQVGAQLSGISGSASVAGAYSQGSGAGSSVSHVLQGATVGKGSIVNVTDSDPAVTYAALQSGEDDTAAALTAGTQFSHDASEVAQAALLSNTTVTGNALNDLGAVSEGAEEVAGASIAAGAADVANNDSFAEAALHSAENEEATSTTAVETTAAESISGASQDAANAQIGENDAVAGQGQNLGSGTVATVSQEQGTSLNNVYLWVSIIGGLLTIWLIFRKGKP